MSKKKRPPCKWYTQKEALEAFALNRTGHQGASHIHPLHGYVACRLVVEGGFHPDEISPHPPFRVETAQGQYRLVHDPLAANATERAVLGGLKTKAVDVVVVKEGIGPVIAVSMKGTLGAFRNLTNRMEEAVGDCTNLHISYPALVYGFLHVLLASRETGDIKPNDIAVKGGAPVSSITRYHDVLSRLTGRDDVRAPTTRYEAVAMALVEPKGQKQGDFFEAFPLEDSPLSFGSFFKTLYAEYDKRFVFTAPALAKGTRRHFWAEDSPALKPGIESDYEHRVGSENESDPIDEAEDSAD